ncbi:Hypothetical protein ZAZAV_416, partial [Cedratvirus Zaza IHUMI]
LLLRTIGAKCANLGYSLVNRERLVPRCTLLVKLLLRTKIAGVRTSELIKPHLGTNRSQEHSLENDWYLGVLTCEHSLENDWYQVVNTSLENLWYQPYHRFS